MPFDPTTPRSRDEVLLQAIVSGDSTPIGDPRDREEEFVKAIADSNAPQTRYRHDIQIIKTNVFTIIMTVVNGIEAPYTQSNFYDEFPVDQVSCTGAVMTATRLHIVGEIFKNANTPGSITWESYANVLRDGSGWVIQFVQSNFSMSDVTSFTDTVTVF